MSEDERTKNIESAVHVYRLQAQQLKAENERLKQVLIIIRDRFAEKIDSNESYLKEMQRISELPESTKQYLGN